MATRFSGYHLGPKDDSSNRSLRNRPLESLMRLSLPTPAETDTVASRLPEPGERPNTFLGSNSRRSESHRESPRKGTANAKTVNPTRHSPKIASPHSRTSNSKLTPSTRRGCRLGATGNAAHHDLTPVTRGDDGPSRLVFNSLAARPDRQGRFRNHPWDRTVAQSRCCFFLDRFFRNPALFRGPCRLMHSPIRANEKTSIPDAPRLPVFGDAHRHLDSRTQIVSRFEASAIVFRNVRRP